MLCRFLGNHILPVPVVLMYHSISVRAPEVDPWELEVHPRRFERQLTLLRDSYRIVTLTQLAEELRDDRLRPNTVAITFDDGYANNVTIAAPILRRLGVPATLFICTGFLDHPTFWWHRLVETIVFARRFPRRMSPDLQWGYGVLRDHRLLGDAGARKNLVLTLWQMLRLQDTPTIDRMLVALEELFEPAPVQRDTRPMMRRDVISALEVFDIGAHSVSHVPLTDVDDDVISFEIVESQRACESLISKPVRMFAYPYGRCNSSVARLIAAHMDAAVVTGDRPVERTVCRYEIPRIQVRDWSPTTLITKMRRVSGAMA